MCLQYFLERDMLLFAVIICDLMTRDPLASPFDINYRARTIPVLVLVSKCVPTQCSQSHGAR